MDMNGHNVFNRYRMRFSTLQFSRLFNTGQYHIVVKTKVTVNSNGQSKFWSSTSFGHICFKMFVANEFSFTVTSLDLPVYSGVSKQ